MRDPGTERAQRWQRWWRNEIRFRGYERERGERGSGGAKKATSCPRGQRLANLAKAYGEAKARALVEGLKKVHPEKSIRTLSYMCSGSGLNSLSIRNNVARMATLKHNQKGAPAYAWYFTWQSPMLEDAGAWHTAELAFCFDNTKRCDQGTGNGPEAQALARKVATAWANFARTGNPSQPGLQWEPFDPTRGQTMVFDNQCRMVNDPEGEVRRLLLA